MPTNTLPTYWVKIYMSGPIEVAKQVCREACWNEGLCVTINPTEYIYTGGGEQGFVVGLINYPRFPKTNEEVYRRAEELAHHLLRATYQYSFLIQDPEKTFWFSKKEDQPVGYKQVSEADAREAFNSMQEQIEAYYNKELTLIYSAYQLDDTGLPINNLMETAYEGPGAITYMDYQSPVINSPTWMQLCGIAEQAILHTKDWHIYFEGIEKGVPDSYNGIDLYALVMGS